MKRNIILLNLFLVLYCNQAKEVSLDSSKSIVGLSLDLVVSNTAASNSGTEFLAVGLGCTIWKSDDGETWTSQSGAAVFPGCSGGNLYSVAYGNGTWVVVGTLTADYTVRSNNTGIWTSKDAETWTQISAPVDSGYSTNLPLRSINFGSYGGVNTFIAAGTKLGTSSGSADRLYIIRSNDGVTWTTMEGLPEFDYGSSNGSCYVTFYNSKLYCPAEYGSYVAALEYDPNNPTSGLQSFPNGSGNSLENLAYGPPSSGVYELNTFQLFPSRNGSFHVFGNLASTGNAVTAKLGATGKWPASVSLGFGTDRPNGIADNGSKLYTFGNNCKWAYSSDQGASWTVLTTLGDCGPTAGYFEWMSAAYSSKLGKIVTVGDSGSIAWANGSPTSPSNWNYLTVSGITAEITSIASKSK